MLITREPQTYPQNPSTSKPFIIKSTIHSIPAFIIMLKSPRVKILIGIDRILTMGLISKLIKPRSKPAIKAILILSHVVSPDMWMKGRKYDATVIEKVSIAQSRTHLNKNITLVLFHGYRCIHLLHLCDLILLS